MMVKKHFKIMLKAAFVPIFFLFCLIVWSPPHHWSDFLQHPISHSNPFNWKALKKLTFLSTPPVALSSSIFSTFPSNDPTT